MILDDIVASTKKRVAVCKENAPFDVVYEKAVSMKINNEFLFKKAIEKDGLSFICEVKKGSPSKGIIAENFPYTEIAKSYENAGADAISVLTEPEFFLGNSRYLKEISEIVSTPLLRKDFVIDEYQIYEAKLLGASAILLICSILTKKQLTEYKEIAAKLGLSVLTETHDEKEVYTALESGADIIGVNNRDLKTFNVDLKNSERLAKLIPQNIPFVSESGIHTPEDIKRVREYGADAVLIGEAFMRSENISGLMNSFRK